MTTPAETGLTIIATPTPMGDWSSPVAEIDGRRVQLVWGVNHLAAPPGVHRVRIHMPWRWKTGKAEITVDSTATPAPPIYYAVSYSTLTPGAIGLRPVKNPGRVVPMLFLVVVVALLLFGCFAATVFQQDPPVY